MKKQQLQKRFWYFINMEVLPINIGVHEANHIVALDVGCGKYAE